MKNENRQQSARILSFSSRDKKNQNDSEVTLADFLQQRAFSVADGLKLSIKLCEELFKHQSAHGLYRYLSTQTIFIHKESLDLKLAANTSELSFDEIPESHWPFMSPEQTGRLELSLDPRSDFYSLGVVLYQIFTGVLPFLTKDFLQIVHDHLASTPKALTDYNANLPKALSQLVLKLLQKAPENRYQTILGLKSDLNLILDKWMSNKNLEDFSIGQSESLGHFQIPEEFYGRKLELKILGDVLRLAKEEHAQTVWIKGEAGIGKTTLVQRLKAQLPRQGVIFLQGKCDVLQQNLPYTPIVQILKRLSTILLSQSGQNLLDWKQALLKQVGPYGKLLTDLAPELELILGVLPTVNRTQLEDYEQQFLSVTAKLFNVFSERGQLLVLNIEDLHWADEATLKLLLHLQASQEHKGILLIGTYRENENHAHGLLKTLTDKSFSHVTQIKLGPLELVEIKKIIIDMFHAPLEQTLILTDLIWQKTHGNPFFIKEFLKHIYHEGLIGFDQNNKQWQWNIFRIREQSVTDNVADILIYQISRLDLKTQNLLKLAACLGHVFDINTIAEIEQQDFQWVKSQLEQACIDNLIVPVDNDETFLRPLENSFKISYRFTHDRIHFAILSQLTEKNKIVLHHKIGKYYLDNLKNSIPVDVHIFSIVQHLNVGFTHELSVEDRLQIVLLNVQAAHKAKSSGAEQKAYQYIQKALSLVDQHCWKIARKQILDAYMEGVSLAYAVLDHQQLQIWIDELNKNASDISEVLFIYTLKMQSLRAQNRLKESLEAGFEVLALLGEKIPRRVKWYHHVFQKLKLIFVKRGRNFETLFSLPAMTDKLSLARLRIYLLILNISTLTSPYHYKILVRQMLFDTWKYGTSVFTSQVLSAYGEILIESGKVSQGKALALMAHRWVSQSPNFSKNKLQNLPQNQDGEYYWMLPIDESISVLAEKYDVSVNQGAKDRSLYIVVEQVLMMLCQGNDIKKSIQLVSNESILTAKFHDSPLYQNYKLVNNVLKNLQGDSESVLDFDLDSKAETLAKNHNFWSEAHYYFFKIYLSCVFGEKNIGLNSLQYFKKRGLKIGLSLYKNLSMNFFESLLNLQSIQDESWIRKIFVVMRVNANQKVLKFWAQKLPEHFKQKWLLIEAEVARLFGRQRLAMDLFDKAIDVAQKNQYLLDASFALERAGRFYHEIGKTRIAKTYLIAADQILVNSGLLAKSQLLHDLFEDYFPSEIRVENPIQLATPALVDWMSVQQAAQVLSRDLEYSELIAKLMDLLIANTAATKAILVVYKHGDKPFVEAEIDVEANKKIYNQSILLEKFDSAPASLIHYVKHAREEVILSESQDDNLFLGDSYFKTTLPKSILCLPLMHHREVLGILYLENQFLEKAFLPERLEVVKLLASQVALTVENAALYATVNSNQWQEGVQAATENGEGAYQDLENEFRQKLVNLFLAATQLWEKTSNKTHIDLAEESKVWKVHIDGGRLRARIMEKYSDIKTLPKNPRWRDVVKTAYFVLSKSGLDLKMKSSLEEEINQLLKLVYQRKTRRIS